MHQMKYRGEEDKGQLYISVRRVLIRKVKIEENITKTLCIKQDFMQGVFRRLIPHVTQESVFQGLTITIKSLYVITYVGQSFGICDACGQTPKSIY